MHVSMCLHQVLQKCEVTGIQTYVDEYGTKRVKAVETNRGTIRTNTVVNAAGAKEVLMER
jgi:glycine/D-amino acid oxidase-like deaminating enzyme